MSMSKLRLLFYLVLPLYFSNCSESEKLTNEIAIELNADNEYFVNGKQVGAEELNKVLSDEKKRLTESRFKEGEITVILRVDEAAKRWALADLEIILRQLNIRKIKYMKEALQYSPDPAQTS